MPLKGNADLQKDKSGYCNFQNKAQVNVFRFHHSSTKGVRSKLVDTLWRFQNLRTNWQQSFRCGVVQDRLWNVFLSIEASCISSHTENSLVESSRYINLLESVLVDLDSRIINVTHRHALLSPPSEPSNYAKFDLVDPPGATFETQTELFSIANLSLKGHGKAFDSFTQGVLSTSLDKFMAHRENIRNLLSRITNSHRRITATLKGGDDQIPLLPIAKSAAFMTVDEVEVRF